MSMQYSDAAVAHNAFTLNFCRSSFSFVAGATAGVLGLTSIPGFVFYFVTSFVMSGIIYLLKVVGGSNNNNSNNHASSAGSKQQTPVVYFKSASELWIGGLLGGLLSYVLFWTMVNGIIRIYD
ncbi:hypothetical protein RI367_000984 [Sorochytrium milnesiophthora]